MIKKIRTGFTLIELLIVVAIIGILAVALVPTISDAPARARDAARKTLVNNVITALESYNIDQSEYPDSTGVCLNSTGPAVPDLGLPASRLTANGNPSHPTPGPGLFNGCTDSVWYESTATGYTVTILLETGSGNAGTDTRYFQVVR